MAKYITNYQTTGNSIVNVDLICKDWNDRFVILTWINDKEEKYTFLVNGKRKNHVLEKTQISKEQAIQIISKLNLLLVKSSTFSSGGTYHSESFIKSETERITQIIKEKEFELSFIEETLIKYKIALYHGR